MDIRTLTYFIMEQTVDVVELVSTLLDSGKYKEALSVPNEEKHVNNFKDNCWDLISVVVGKIQDETVVIKPSLHGTCEELLFAIVQKSAPEAALLEFIEQIEVAKNDAQFSIILTPLQYLLKKLSVKRGRSLEWCLNSISTYIEAIPIPEYDLDGEERLLMDCDPNIRRITKVYSLLPPFYTPFIKELNASEPSIHTKQILVAFLISILGKPVIHIDLDPDTNAQSEVRQCCASIIKDICSLERDVLKFLYYVDVCHKENKKAMSKKGVEEGQKTPYENRDKINMSSLSGLFYIVLSGHFQLPEHSLPQVYSVEYIVHTALHCVIHLLGFTDYGPLAKAISMGNALVNRFSSKISHNLLHSSVHFDFLKSVVNVAIYSTYQSLRTASVSLIRTHVEKFDYKGRCMLIKYLLDVSNHSGMIGYVITMYKNSLDESFKEAHLPECFTGTQFKSMVKKICHLPHGAESDLVELADQIITAINFMRYIAIKDTEDATGMRGCYANIENDYLNHLRTGVNMSKAHYQVKLKDLEEGKKNPKERMKVSINVGGNTLDNIPTKQKIEVINSALNALHLIEGLIARLTECININKMQVLNMDCE